jgi:hypothetical protein
MAANAPFQMELTSEQLDLIGRWSSMAGCETKQELLLDAFALFEWAAKQVMLGRKICAMDEASGEIRHAQVPALAVIADWGAPPPLTLEERRRLSAEPGYPLPEHFFRIRGERDVEADRCLDDESHGRSGSHLDSEPATP